MSSILSSLEQAKRRFLKRSYGWVGIEIGCHVVRMAQIKKTDRRWELVTVWSVEQATPYNRDPKSESAHSEETFGWRTPEVLRKEGLGATLEHFKNLDSLFRGQECAATFSDGVIDYRELELPTCEPTEVHSLLQSEVTLESERDFDDLLTDYWELPANRPRPTTNSYGVVSLDRSAAILTANDLLRSGFECRVLDAMPCAIASASSMMTGDSSLPTLAIDLGYQQTTITLVHNGKPILSRASRSIGLLSFLEQIAQGLEISVADAQTLLFQLPKSCKTVHAGDTDFANPLQQRLGGFLHALVHEIDRTLHYTQKAHRTMVPNEIVLMGEGTRIRNIAESLEQQIGLCTKIWSLDVSENIFGNQPIATYAVASALSSLAWEDA
jgi:type IV pilus assembly protein PilM